MVVSPRGGSLPTTLAPPVGRERTCSKRLLLASCQCKDWCLGTLVEGERGRGKGQGAKGIQVIHSGRLWIEPKREGGGRGRGKGHPGYSLWASMNRPKKEKERSRARKQK